MDSGMSHNFTHRVLAVPQRRQDPATRGVGKGLESICMHEYVYI
jgi:hypothetical protein